MKCLFFGSIVSFGGACTKDTVIDHRTITLYTFAQSASQPACSVPLDALAFYSAAGDFQPDVSDTLTRDLAALPNTTKQLFVDVKQDPAHWRGFGPVGSGGDVGILLWPAGQECSFTTTVDARPGSQIAVYDDRHVLVTGGAGLPSFIADLSNGSVTQLSRSQDGILKRSNATATSFGAGVLVAGGDTGNNDVQSTAEIFDANSGAFTGKSIDLILKRTHHAAVRLTNGDVVLIGGASETGGLYAALELVDPAQGRANVYQSALSTARKDPTAITLTNGEILVAGGTDAGGNPVPTLEWFSADASAQITTAKIDASLHEAFVPLPAGGALGVVSPSTGPTTVWVVQSDHTVVQAPSIASLPSNAPVKLFAGADGSPMLWTGTSWFRWSPWTGAFVLFTETESASGGSSAAGPPDDATPAVLASPDPGLALWLDDSGSITGLRFDARGPYSTDVKTLLASDTQSIAPDRLPSASLTFTNATGTGSGLGLGAGAQVVVADANYGDFSLDLDTGKLQTPVVFFRDESGVDFTLGVDRACGDSACTCVVDDANHWHIERKSGAVSISADDAPLTTCATSLISAARLTIGLRGRSAPTTVTATARNLVVKRD